MEQRYILGILFLTVLHFSARGDDVMTIASDFWKYRLKNNPTYATYHGSNDYNDLMESFDINRFNESRVKAEEFLGRLTRLEVSRLNKSDKINYDILQDTLQTFLDGNIWSMYGSLNPISFINGIQLFSSPGMAPSSTRGDFENYIARLHAVQTQVDQIKNLFRKAIELGRTLHNVSLVRVPGEIDAKLIDPPENSSYYDPFLERLDNSHIPENISLAIRSRGRTAVAAYIEAFRDLKNFIINEYMPHTREDYGVHVWDPTNQYYTKCLKWHLSFAMSPEEVHRLGLEEVERIRGKMRGIMTKLGFQGSVKEFFDSLEGDSRFYSNDTEKILGAYNDTVFKMIYPKLPEYFKDVPYVPLNVEASTYDGLGGGYSSASENSPGTFSINLFRPDEVPFFEMMALSLHETVPGHHLQHSYSMKAYLPSFRKYSILSFYNVPNWYPFYSAYMEGWALYSEYLGEEMGLYKTDYDLMGRYSYEILRAVRLVVDTGIHYYKWSRDKAIDYMTNYTAMAYGSAANEIDRYITWPGQACAYKIGEIKMRQLRQNAEEKLGSKFNLKEFHKVLLENGGMPLSLLETMVDDWTVQVQQTAVQNNSETHRCTVWTLYILTLLPLLNIWTGLF